MDPNAILYEICLAFHKMKHDDGLVKHLIITYL